MGIHDRSLMIHDRSWMIDDRSLIIDDRSLIIEDRSPPKAQGLPQGKNRKPEKQQKNRPGEKTISRKKNNMYPLTKYIKISGRKQNKYIRPETKQNNKREKIKRYGRKQTNI